MSVSEIAVLGGLLVAVVIAVGVAFRMKLYRAEPPARVVQTGPEPPARRRLTLLRRDPLALLLVAVFITLYVAQILGARSSIGLLGLETGEDSALRDAGLIALGAYTGAMLGVFFCSFVLRDLGALLVNGLVPKRIVKDLGVGLGWFVLVMPMIMAVAFVSTQIVTLVTQTPPEALGHETLGLLASGQGPWWAWWLTVGAVTIGAPVIEEILYRGCLQSCVRRFLKGWGAIILTSLLFALIHYNVAAIRTLPALFALSLAMGLVYERTGRLMPCIVVHALFNATNVLVATQISSGSA